MRRDNRRVVTVMLVTAAVLLLGMAGAVILRNNFNGQGAKAENTAKTDPDGKPEETAVSETENAVTAEAGQENSAPNSAEGAQAGAENAQNGAAEKENAGADNSEEESLPELMEGSSAGGTDAAGRTDGNAGTADSKDGKPDAAGDKDGSTDAAGKTDAAAPETDPALEEAKKLLAEMSLEEKVGQLFFVTADQLTGVSGATIPGETTRETVREYAVGGIIYFPQNLRDPEQTKTLLAGTKAIYEELGLPVPFLSTDEEGGTVARIAGNSAFGVEDVGNMIDVGEGGTTEDAARVGHVIGSYMADLGFNMDFAPCADVLTNPENEIVALRVFGSDPAFVRDMVCAESDAMMEEGILPVWKHFPGHGATAGDTHKGYSYTDKSLEELLTSDLVPYENANEHAPCIMAAHISLPGVTGDEVPATLSDKIITGLLREKLGYNGVIITDALNMSAVAEVYTSAEAAALALAAGNDMLLMPADFRAAHQGVLAAVRSGTVTEERIDESVLRILRLKCLLESVEEDNETDG